MPEKHFLFLQGMPCSFFARLGKKLLANSHRVSRINLCVGDWWFWHGPQARSYRGSLADWPEYIRTYLVEQRVTDLVLLGEQRKYHKEAVAVAQSLGIRVTVTDFGYLRPDWITLERDGMGGNSHFPRDPVAIRAAAKQLDKPDFIRRYTDSTLRMAIGDLFYSFSNVFLHVLYPRYRRSEARPHPLVYFPLMGWRMLFAKTRQRKAIAQFQAIKASGATYFIFPLQLEHDFQIVAYSPYRNLDEPIAEVIRSFASLAGPTRLLIKSHPWEPGLKNWGKRIRCLAASYGVGDRIDYLDGGDLDAMIEGALGMVTVNSTSGLRALQLGCPVKVLGQAAFDVEEMTFRGSLNDFWTAPSKPDATLVEAYINLMAASIQIRGTYFSPVGAEAGAEAAASRLGASTVGVAIFP